MRVSKKNARRYKRSRKTPKETPFDRDWLRRGMLVLGSFQPGQGGASSNAIACRRVVEKVSASAAPGASLNDAKFDEHGCLTDGKKIPRVIGADFGTSGGIAMFADGVWHHSETAGIWTRVKQKPA